MNPTKLYRSHLHHPIFKRSPDVQKEEAEVVPSVAADVVNEQAVENRKLIFELEHSVLASDFTLTP